MDIREQIKWARKNMEYDPHLANYGLRDTPEIEAANLKDLSWVMHNDAYISKSDLVYLIEKLD